MNHADDVVCICCRHCICSQLQYKVVAQEPAVERSTVMQQESYDTTTTTTCTSGSTPCSTTAVTTDFAVTVGDTEASTASSLVDVSVTTVSSTPAHGSSLTSALQGDVVSDVVSGAANSCDLQLLTELMHAGYVLGEFIEWQRQLKQYSDAPITVDSTLSALRQWSSYYAQQQLSPDCSYYKQQQYAARVPQLEHLIKDLECVSAACDSDPTTVQHSDRSVLSKWSATVIGSSQQAHARVQQVNIAT
jgi:hypothetical protein